MTKNQPCPARSSVPLIFSLLAVLLLGPIAASAQPGTPSASAGEPRVTEAREVRIDDGWPLALSPDGNLLAVWRDGDDDGGGVICAYDAATLTERICAPPAARSVDPNSAAWSPDGTRLAFTENFAMYLDEPDLWVFDAVAGTVTNLTDDGIERLLEAQAVGDLTPAWSPDGAELAFSRSTGVETALYRVPATGGEPRRIAAIGPDERYAVWAGMRWLPDDTILASVDPTVDDELAGLWTVPVSGGEPRRLIEPDPIAGPPILTAASDGGRAVLYYPHANASRDPAVPVFALADLATGRVEPIQPVAPHGTAAADAGVPARVWAAAFSPDGTRLLAVSSGQGSVQRLTVRDLATGNEHELPLPAPLLLATHPAGGGVTWADNDLVFALGPARSGVLLLLEED